MRQLRKVRCPLVRDQRGFSLIEILFAVAILGLIGVAFLTALNTASRSTGLYEQRVTAASLAQSQVEEIKAATYEPSGNYTQLIPPPGYDIYDIAISVNQTAVDKQEVTVTVSKDGHHLFDLVTIKTNWW